MNNTQITDEMVKAFIEREFFPINTPHVLERWEKHKSAFKVDKKEWEILTSLQGETIHDYKKSGCLRDGCSIHSVKRISTGEILTVGDELVHIDGSYRTKIIDFVIPQATNSMWFHFEEDKVHVKDLKNFEKAPIPSVPERELLFVTEDGKNIFEGDTYAYVPKETLGWINISDGKSIPQPKESFIYFSTGEIAQEYVLMNKRCLSINDVKSVYSSGRSFIGTDFLIDNLKQLVPSKSKP